MIEAMRKAACIRLLLLLVASSCFSTGALAQQTTSAAWAGWARCQVTVQGPGYADQQTHTWTIAGGAPTPQGAFQIYAGTWAVVGGGSLSRTQGAQTLMAQWATNGPSISAPIAVFVRASDNRMFIQARHAQLRSASAIQGFQQLTIDGKPQTPGKIAAEAFEWAFPVIAVSAPVPPATNATASGSSTLPVNGSVGPMQPAGSQAAASCTWQFGQGSAAPAPPPTLTAQAIPTPTNPATTSPPANNPPVTTTPPTTSAKLLSISPTTVEQGAIGTVLTITGQGTHWLQRPTVVVAPDIGAPVTNTEATSDTDLLAQLDVQYAATPGPRTITVTAGSEVVSLPNALTVTARARPELVSVTPNRAKQGEQNRTVQLVGRNTRWAQGATRVQIARPVDGSQPGIAALSPGVTVLSTTVRSPTSASAVLNVDANAVVGSYWFSVFDAAPSDGLRIVDGFTIEASGAMPNPGATQRIRVTNPNGGETWLAGVQANVSWIHDYGDTQTFDVDFSGDGGQTWRSLQRALKPDVLNAASHEFAASVRMPALATTSGVIRISPTANSAAGAPSDNRFTLVTPSVSLTSPIAGARWTIASDAEITWSVNATGGVYPAKLEISRDGGATWSDVGTIVPEGFERSRVWRVTGPPSTRARARVTLFDRLPPTVVGAPAESADFMIADATPGGGTQTGGARLLSVSPPSVEQGVSLSDVITLTGEGTYWQQGATTVNLGAGVTIQGGVRVLSPTSLTTQLTVSYAAAHGPRAISVTTGNELVTLANALTIIAREQPVITQISPNSALAGAQNVTLTFTGRGTRWEQGKTALLLNNAPGLTQASAVSVTSPTSMTVSLSIAPSAAPGPREITVLNSGVVVGSDIITVAAGFTVNPPGPADAPKIVSVTPSAAEQGVTGYSVTLNGQLTHWQRQTPVVSFGPGITILGQPHVLSANRLSVLLQVTYAADPGPRAVTVTTGAEVVSLANAFTITARAEPRIESITANTAPAGSQNMPVVFVGSGTRWVQGQTRMTFSGTGIRVEGDPTVQSSTRMTATLSIDSTATPGARDVTVLNGGPVIGAPIADDTPIAIASDVIVAPGGFTVSPPRSALDAVVVVPISPSLLPIPEVCLLRGPGRGPSNLNHGSPGAAYLVWTSVTGATSYTVSRRDLGVLTATPLAETRNSFKHQAMLSYPTTYVYTITARYPQGCGSTDITISPRPPWSPNVGSTMGTGAGSITLSWAPINPNASRDFNDFSGVQITGPGLPPTGRHIPNSYSSGSGSTTITGVPAGSKTWTLKAYWDTPGGRVIDSTGKTTTLLVP